MSARILEKFFPDDCRLENCLPKNVPRKIFIIVSCWHINKTINFSLQLESSSSRRVISYFLWLGLAWIFFQSHVMSLLELGVYLWGHLSLHYYKCSLQDGLIWEGLIEFGTFAKCSRSIIKKVAVSSIIPSKFLVIPMDSSIWGQLYIKVTAHELFPSFSLRTMRLISFVYIATSKLFRITLSYPFCLTRTCAVCSCFLKNVKF